MANIVHPVKYSSFHAIPWGRGFDSNSDEEFVRFLRYGLRSATEVQSHLYVALDQQYVDKEAFDLLYNQASKVKSPVSGFIRYLRS